MDYRNYDRGYAEPTMSASDYMTRTYRWMACGLLITFAMAVSYTHLDGPHQILQQALAGSGAVRLEQLLVGEKQDLAGGGCHHRDRAVQAGTAQHVTKHAPRPHVGDGDPVSYTHLDVYKRQVSGHCRRNRCHPDL